MHAQLIDQLIIPKLNRSIESHTSKSYPLHQLIFPWLPMLKSKSALVLEKVKYKLSAIMRSWQRTDDKLCETFTIWKEVIKGNLFDSIVSQSILPRLSGILGETIIDPSNQSMAEVYSVLGWKNTIGESTMQKLVDDVFFPKWINVLRLWLETRAYSDVGRWYACWKVEFFGLQCNGFVKGLDIINAHLVGVILKDDSFNHVKMDMNARSLLLSKKASVKLLTFKVIIITYR